MNFLRISVIDLLDIFLVAIAFFYIYRFLRKILVSELFYGIITFYVVWRIVQFSKMKLLIGLLDAFFNIRFIALVIIFQPEIRKFLFILGSRAFLKHLILFNYRPQTLSLVNDQVIDQIIEACAIFSGDKTGGLIVLQNKVKIDEFIQNGDIVSARVSVFLLESIFYKNGPLHDGAVVISGDQIIRTRAILPVSYNKDIPSRLGLRHRAAIGLSEKTDAICIVISEETGYISYVKDQKRILIPHIDNLKQKLKEDINYNF